MQPWGELPPPVPADNEEWNHRQLLCLVGSCCFFPPDSAACSTLPDLAAGDHHNMKISSNLKRAEMILTDDDSDSAMDVAESRNH